MKYSWLAIVFLAGAVHAGQKDLEGTTPETPIGESKLESSSKGTGNGLPSREELAEMRRKAATLPSAKKREAEELLAEIERRLDELDNVRFIDTSANDSSDDARAFVARYTSRIEDCGNAHFPVAKNRKLYGKVVVKVHFLADGSLKRTSVIRTSGDAQLDAHALRVVEASAPFGQVPQQISEGKYREFAFLASLNFLRDDLAPPLSSLPPSERCLWTAGRN